MIELSLNEFGITEKNGVPMTSSVKIADIFNKDHDKVLRTIKNTIEGLAKIGESDWSLNFKETHYNNSQNKKQPCYLLTKKGFSLIAMSFTGEKALMFKTKYIDAFEAMEGFIRDLVQCRLDFPEFTEAILMAHDEPKHYHFSNELDMINRIVMGMTAKQFRELHNIDKAKSIRPYLQAHEIKYIQLLQKADIGLIEVEKDFNKRKEILTAMYQKRIIRNQKQIAA